MESLHKQESIASLIVSFVKDLGPHGALSQIIENGKEDSMRVLFDEFRVKHPDVDIDQGEFNNYVIETLKRTSAAIAAETGAIPGSMIGAGFAKMLSLTPDLAGSLAFSGNMVLNFMSFGAVWIKSHYHKFLDENGKFNKRAFIKSFLREYGEHFGPIAISADFLEAKIIQHLTNKDLDYVGTAGLVTFFGSILAVCVYFYEQQARLKLHRFFEKNDMGRVLARNITAIRSRIHEMLMLKLW